MVRGMGAMARRGMGMVGGGVGLLIFIMFGGHAVMMGGLFMMLGGGVMMGTGGMLVRHGKRSVLG